jgi:hypothetical protein
MSLDADAQRSTAFRDAYELALACLPANCEDRLELAAVIGWSAMTGCNQRAMARGMKRSRSWIVPRLKRARELVLILTAQSAIDDYLS